MHRIRHVALVSLAVLALSACGTSPRSPEPSQNDPSVSEAAPSPTAAEGSAAPEESAAAGAGTAMLSWGFPGNAEGWEVTVFDQQGVNQIRHAETGCVVTYRQNQGAMEAKQSGLGPVDSVDVYLSQVQEEGEAVEQQDATPLSFPRGVAGEGPALEFVTKAVSYTYTDGVRYLMLLGAQHVGDTELFLAASCPEAEWDGDGRTAVELAFSETGVLETPA